jgi:hypothetical protein
MSLKSGDKFTWTDPGNKEVYTFVADEVVEFGNIFTITLNDGTTFDAFGQEINCPESIDILDEQVNPEDDDEPVRYGAMR